MLSEENVCYLHLKLFEIYVLVFGFPVEYWVVLMMTPLHLFS